MARLPGGGVYYVTVRTERGEMKMRRGVYMD